MKKNILSLMLIIGLIACSEENPELYDELGKGDGNHSIDGGMLGLDGVFIWEKENEIVLTDYYSQLDTLIADRLISREVKYYCLENENVVVKWSSNAKITDTKETSKVWKGDIQKWLVVNTVTLDINGVLENLQLEANVQFHNRNVRRFKTIPKISIKKDISDVFGFTFGTSRTEMNNYIERDISPQFSIARMEEKITLFEFSNGKLIRLYKYDYYSSFYPGFDNFLFLCKIPERLKFESSYPYNIINPQEWNIGKLKIKAFNTTINDILGVNANNNNLVICAIIDTSLF